MIKMATIKKLRKKVRKTARKAAVALPAFMKNAKKRRCIDIAIPTHRLWVCKLGKNKVAFIKGHRNFPLGIIAKQKKRGKHEVLLTVRPFDSTEHEHVISHLCA